MCSHFWPVDRPPHKLTKLRQTYATISSSTELPTLSWKPYHISHVLKLEEVPGYRKPIREQEGKSSCIKNGVHNDHGDEDGN
jgi:hypothetical protein